MEDNTKLGRFADVIRKLDLDAVQRAGRLPSTLLLEAEGRLESYYSPFDWTNRDARLVLVGITPGFSQSLVALRKAKELLQRDMPIEQVVRDAKRAGGFTGKLRPNLVALLDHFALHRWLGIDSCDELFEYRSDFLHTTSMLRFPTFADGKNYNGTPAVLKTTMLKRLLLNEFGQELSLMRDAVFVPLGPKVAEVMDWLANEGRVDPRRVLAGVPHPSTENGERVNYVLGLKPRTALSAKTDADKLDRASAALRQKIATLPTVTLG